MAKKKDSTKVGLKWKKKKWIPIVAPKIFNEREIGTTLVENKADAVGRTVETSLGQIIGNLRKQNVLIKLKIENVENDRANTSVVEYKLQPASVKRLVRKSMSKLEDSFNCTTKDGTVVRIKPLLTTKSRANSSKKQAIYHKVRRFIVDYAGSVTYEQLMQDLVSIKLQREMKSTISKINPLRACHIRYCGINKERNPHIVKPAKETPAKEKKEEKKKKKPVRKRKKKTEKEATAKPEGTRSGQEEKETKVTEKETGSEKKTAPPTGIAEPKTAET